MRVETPSLAAGLFRVLIFRTIDTERELSKFRWCGVPEISDAFTGEGSKTPSMADPIPCGAFDFMFRYSGTGTVSERGHFLISRSGT